MNNTFNNTNLEHLTRIDSLQTNLSDPILSDFTNRLVSSFYSELNQYINVTGDFMIVEYATERAFLSMMLNGYCRGATREITDVCEPEFALLQEYTLRLSDGKSGRPDCFFILGKELATKKGFWIESKFNGFSSGRVTDKHWDISNWMRWDGDILEQAEKYYKAEVNITEDKILDYYQALYLMTVCFKLVTEVPKEHFEKAKRLGKNSQAAQPPFSWYYSVAFLNDPNNKKNFEVGIEVYGSLKTVYIANM